MRSIFALGSVALALLATADPAAAADAALPALPPQFDWTGVYVGAHVGYSRGDARITTFDPAG